MLADMLFHVCGFSEQEQEVIGMAFTRDKGVLALTFTNDTLLCRVIPRRKKGKNKEIKKKIMEERIMAYRLKSLLQSSVSQFL